MNLSFERDYKKISLVLIFLTVIINVLIFNIMPPDMLVKINMNQVMPKLGVLVLCPILSVLSLRIAKDRDERSYYIANIVVQIILFITNLIVIYINLPK